MMHPSPSTIAWLGLALVAGSWLAGATSATDAPAELPPPVAVADAKADAAAAKADAAAAASAKRKPDPADGRCDRCEGCACVRRVCVATRTEKEITKVCWSYRCEEFCIPGPSIHCGEKCLHDSCGCWTHPIWQPTCAEVRIRRVPVKHQVKRKVPAVEWTVEERCRDCRVLCFGVGGHHVSREAIDTTAEPDGRDGTTE